MNGYNTKGSVSTPFKYTSDINISFRCQGHPFVLNFKNRGEKQLFDIITQALCGYDITDSLPDTFDVQHMGGSGTDAYDTCLRKIVPFTGKVYGDSASTSRGESGVMSLTTVLTYEDKKSLGVLNNPRLVLKGKDGSILCTIGGEYSAQIQQMWSLVTKDTDALIEWKLIFNNGD